VFIERELLYLLGLLRKWEQQPRIFNKQESLTELPRKLNLVTTACNIYDSHLGCDAVSNVGQWLPTCKRTSKAWGPFTKRHGATSQKMFKNLKSRMQFFFILYFVLRPTNAQLIHKLSHSYMFRHYCVILRVLVISTLPSYATRKYFKCTCW
jgi:hypothetical protein